MLGKVERFKYKSNNTGNEFVYLRLVCENGMLFRLGDSKCFNLGQLELYTYDLINKGKECINVEYHLHKDFSKNNIQYFYLDFELFPNYFKRIMLSNNDFIALGGKI